MYIESVYRNKALGSTIGGAVGDALGYPVEFLSYNAIVQKYGEKGIPRYELNCKGILYDNLLIMSESEISFGNIGEDYRC